MMWQNVICESIDFVQNQASIVAGKELFLPKRFQEKIAFVIGQSWFWGKFIFWAFHI